MKNYEEIRCNLRCYIVLISIISDYCFKEILKLRMFLSSF